MKSTSVALATLAMLAMLCNVTPPAFAASTPKPKPAPTRVVIQLPTIPLHSEVTVEVNAKGQVVRVKSTKPSKRASFNFQTYGNALQMWIRKPDGSAQVGLYRVIYDYNPKTQTVTRHIALISTGGNWANEPGAANVMVEMEKKQAAAAAETERKEQEKYDKLPSLNQIRGAPTPKPTPKPPPPATLPPRSR